ncbi:MAG: hypothetical protein QXS16_03615 [Pyrobaculum sp.]
MDNTIIIDRYIFTKRKRAMTPNKYIIAGIVAVLAIAAIAAIVATSPTQATSTAQEPAPQQPQQPTAQQTPATTPPQQTPQDAASRASLEEEIYLRTLTGVLVGRTLLNGYQKVALVTVPDRICSSLAAATATSFINNVAGYRDGVAKIFVYEPGREREVARRIKEFGAEAVYIVYGGEQSQRYVANITKKTLEALAAEGYDGALLIHVRIFLATNRLQTVLEDPALREYLTKVREIRVFTADLQRKEFLFHRVEINGTSIRLNTYCRVPLTDEHVNLLRISLPPP